MKNVIIVQGGGFRTAFTAGILDSFMSHKHNPFDAYIGISGGAIALSYYIGEQYAACIEAMKHLSKSDSFFSMRRLMSDTGYMDIDQLRTVADYVVPFDVAHAMTMLGEKHAHFISTNKDNGQAEYLVPGREDWVDVVIASCTLPFVTKGTHQVRGLDLMDGGWGDPLPVKWAVEQGAENILILRTTHIDKRFEQSWPDYLGSKLYRSNPALHKIFGQNHEIYNSSLEYIENPPKGVNIEQIWPEEGLQCGTYGHAIKAVLSDYRYGIHQGLDYLNKTVLNG